MNLLERLNLKLWNTGGEPAGGGGSPPPDSGPGPSAPSEPSLSDVLKFDMFGPSETPNPPSPAPAEVTPAGQPTPAPAGTPAAPAPTSPAGAQPEAGAVSPPAPATPPQDSMAQLASQINQLLQRSQPQAPAPATQTPAGPPAPKFNIGAPPELIRALRSEDDAEFARGMHAMLNGVANMVWDASMKHIQEEVLPQISQVVSAHHSAYQEAQSIQTDFYGRYKHVDNDAFRPLIQQIGLQIYNEMRAVGRPTNYTPQVGDEIIRRLHAMLPALGPVPTVGAAQPPAPAPAPAPVAPAARRQPLNGAGGTRPSPDGPAPGSVQADILDVVRA